MNQFFAERKLSAVELINPETKKEKVYLTFQNDIDVGPPQIAELGLPIPKRVDMFNSFKKSRTYGGDGVDWNEELREKVRREQRGEVDSFQYDLPVWQRGTGSKVAPPTSAQGSNTYALSRLVPSWEHNDPWAKWNISPGA